MKLSLGWLKEFVDLTLPVPEIVEALTFSGVEVESVQHRVAEFDKVVVAQIVSFERHPNADRLSVCRVDDGSGTPRQIVCGAKNFEVGDKVPLALPGAILPGGIKIKASKLRGVESEGMLCSARELMLAEDAEGLLILPATAPIGTSLSNVFPPDTIIDLEVTPNRPDLLSHFGIARELAALLELSTPRLPHVMLDFRKATEDAAVVQLTAPSGCPLYSAWVIRRVQVGASPAWLSQRLEAGGLRSINNVVDVTNYVMLELGQPLHAFDLGEISGGIVVRMANPGERVLALDQKEYELNVNDLVIADHQRALAIAGVMGGEGSGVTAVTTDILLEAAYFRSDLIRRTSRRLGLISESSFRFERGVDPAAVLFAAARAASLISEVTGGKADEHAVVGGFVPNWRRLVELRPERCEKLLGMPVPDSASLLTRLGLRNAGGNQWEIPSYRPDLARETDLVEEVCRMAGIKKIPARLLATATEASRSDRAHDELMRLRLKLADQGLFEARSLTLIDERSLEYLLEPVSEPLKLRNPLSEDQKILRPSLLPGLVRAAERNFNRGATSVAMFEIGRVFGPGAEEEVVNLALLVSGERQRKAWNQAEATYGLFDLKGILKIALAQNLTLVRDEPTSFAPLLCQIVDSTGESVGRIAQLRPSLAKEIGARHSVLVAELSLHPGEVIKRFKYEPLDRFPAVTRDVAFLADKELKFKAVLDAIAAANEPLLVDIHLFDLFVDLRGEKIPVNKKSIACSLTYRATDRTLTQDEANAAHARVKSQIAAQLGVTFRE
jgi:phenylalanyl-tRNA synthetase beta chain